MRCTCIQLDGFFGQHLSDDCIRLLPLLNARRVAGEKVAWNFASSRVEGEVAEKKPEKVVLLLPLLVPRACVLA